MAKRSATECAAVLDVVRRLELSAPEPLAAGRAPERSQDETADELERKRAATRAKKRAAGSSVAANMPTPEVQGPHRNRILSRRSGFSRRAPEPSW